MNRLYYLAFLIFTPMRLIVQEVMVFFSWIDKNTRYFRRNLLWYASVFSNAPLTYIYSNHSRAIAFDNCVFRLNWRLMGTSHSTQPHPIAVIVRSFVLLLKNGAVAQKVLTPTTRFLKRMSHDDHSQTGCDIESIASTSEISTHSDAFPETRPARTQLLDSVRKQFSDSFALNLIEDTLDYQELSLVLW